MELPTILRINQKECCYDHTRNSLRFPIEHSTVVDFSPFIEHQDYSTIYFDGKLLVNGEFNNLGTVETNKEYTVIIETSDSSKEFLLTFTDLPIVQIITPNSITDDPKTIGRIIVNYAELDRESDQYFIGLEHRGGSSLAYQKKSIGCSLKGSVDLDDDVSNSFFDMKSNNDWILDAMWVDKARIRNLTSFELWKSMGGVDHFGIEGRVVELYMNNDHQGVYSLNENINTEWLSHSSVPDVLYKAVEWESGATRFETYVDNPSSSAYWDGWEQKHPDPQMEINWEPLNSLRRHVVNETDEVFVENISSKIELDLFVDYYLFLNLVSAADNTGKNTFLYRESGEEKFNLIPWDLDGSWGLDWDGAHVGFTTILSNHLFDRLLETNAGDFRNKVKLRWSALRSDVFSNAGLENLFTHNFNLVGASGVIQIENDSWGSAIDIEQEQDYLFEWLEGRLPFLDAYFESL
ncbi:MAG: spore coat protein H [Flavobacteriales bacterium]